MGSIWVYEQDRDTDSVNLRLQFSNGYMNAVGTDGYIYVELYKEADVGTLTYNDRAYKLDNTYTIEVEENEYMWRMTSRFTLLYDTRYLVKCRYKAWNVNGGTYIATLQLCYVAPWGWSVSNGANATAVQVSTAYTAISEAGLTKKFSHLVWNDLVDKVDKILFHLNAEWNVYYDTYNSTLMTNTDAGRTLTALRYDSLKYQIGHIYGTGIEDVSQGDYVIGQTHFIDLVTKLNDWMASLEDYIYGKPNYA